jgi:hypothetical protein
MTEFTGIIRSVRELYAEGIDMANQVKLNKVLDDADKQQLLSW